MTSDAETQRLLGEINGTMKSLLERMDKVEKKLDSVVAMTNRWKGATAVLVIIGGFIGWLSNLLLKMSGKG